MAGNFFGFQKSDHKFRKVCVHSVILKITLGLKLSDIHIFPCTQKTREMKRDKLERKEYMEHVNALNSTKNSAVDALAYCAI